MNRSRLAFPKHFRCILTHLRKRKLCRSLFLRPLQSQSFSGGHLFFSFSSFRSSQIAHSISYLLSRLTCPWSSAFVPFRLTLACFAPNAPSLAPVRLPHGPQKELFPSSFNPSLHRPFLFSHCLLTVLLFLLLLRYGFKREGDGSHPPQVQRERKSDRNFKDWRTRQPGWASPQVYPRKCRSRRSQHEGYLSYVIFLRLKALSAPFPNSTNHTF